MALAGMALQGAALADAAAPGDKALEAFFTRLRDGQPQTVVAYGTSLTEAGYWVAAMREWFAAQYPGKVTVVNAGGSGQNSDWGAASVGAKVLPHKPDVVVVEFSYNDAHRKFNLPVERCRTNLNMIVTAIREQNPAAAVVLQTMNPPWDVPGGRTNATDRPNLSAYNDVVRAYAAEKGLTFVDHHAAWQALRAKDESAFRKMVPDGSHPNKDGSLAVTWAGLQRAFESAQGLAPK
jgi:lysophospholipase L1-like esterase